MDNKFIIIGGGNMGTAFAVLALEKNIFTNKDVVIVERLEERRKSLEASLSCAILPEIPEVKSGTVLLAVKPQDFHTISEDFRKKISLDCLIVSIMAGVQIRNIEKTLGGYKKIVRCMPNLALQVGEAMTGFFPTDAVSESELELVKKILSAGGESIKVKQEDDLDNVTALSGSGPAYVFYFIEAFCKAAHQFGFNDDEALKIAIQTFRGSVSFLEKSDLSCTELRKRVTSKGGTTEAAIKAFDEGNVFNSIIKGINDAQRRSVELGKN